MINGTSLLLPPALVALALSIWGCFADRFWTAELATCFRPHLLLSALVLLLLAGLLSQRVTLGVALAALLVNGAVLAQGWQPFRAPHAALPSATTEPEVAELSVLSLNVYFRNQQPEEVLRLIREVSPDIVVLAEASGSWTQRLRELGALYPFGTLGQAPGTGGTMVLSRHPVRQVQVLSPPARLVDRRSTTLAVDIETGEGQSLRVVAVHPPYPVKRELWRLRNQYLAWLASTLADHKGPLVVAGDFNTTSWSPALREFQRGAGLRDAAGAAWPGPTWRPFRLRAFTWLGLPIDHILASPDLAATEFAVLSDVGSDHLPLLARLSLPGRGGS